MTKTIRTAGIVGALILALLCSAAVGAGAMTASVNNVTVNIGDTVYVPIEVLDASNVGAVDLSLTYNLSVLSPTGLVNTGDVTTGALVMNDDTIDQPEYPDWTNAMISVADNQTVWDYGALANYTGMSGVVNISIISNASDIGFNGAGSVALVGFTVIGSGESPLDLSVTAYNVSAPIVDGTGNTTGYEEISVTIENGTLTAGEITGDLNGDTKVDIDDLILLGQAWGTYSGDPGYNSAADINDDGEIDIDDLILLGQSWTG
jgi:hypothetical protein